MVELLIANLPIVVCFLIGVGLLVLEAFMPGFGIAGVSGVALEAVTVALTWMNHGWIAAVGMLLVVLSVLTIAVSMSLRSVAKGKLSKSRIILHETESNEAGYRSSQDMEVFLGKEGMTTTVLRPTGMAEFEGVKLNVVSDGEFIQAGAPVRIIRVEGSKILVRAM